MPGAKCASRIDQNDTILEEMRYEFHEMVEDPRDRDPRKPDPGGLPTACAYPFSVTRTSAGPAYSLSYNTSHTPAHRNRGFSGV
jgi:hypothetical protein